MGLFDAFKKKSDVAPESLNINITDNGIQLNGALVRLPCPVDSLTAILGRPREVVYQTPKSQINPMMLAQFPELAAKRINYTWDALGVYCYTRSDSMVNCIGVQHKVRLKVNHTPESLFCGTLTINGIPWYEAVRKGIDMEAYRQIDIGNNSVISGYSDFSRPESLGTADDYTGIEFQPKK